MVSSSWVVDYSVILYIENDYLCDSPYCKGHHYEPSSADLTYQKTAPHVDMIIGPYEEVIPEDELYQNMSSWQKELKKRMNDDIDNLPLFIDIVRYFSFMQCLE